MKCHIKKLLSLFILPLFALGLLQAQETSSLVGTVTDATGAVLPGTSVTLTNSQTGFSASQTTDATGFYRFLKVPSGVGYVASYANSGFTTTKISDIALAVGQTRTQNAKLALGKNVETVEVSAKGDIVTIDTTSATIGNNTDVGELNEVPIYDRSGGITTLFRQQAGVDANSGAITGARTDQSTVTVDGLDVNDFATGTAFGIAGTAPVDSVAQFTGSVAGLNSDTGTGSGGQFNLVTKGGTNKFHGNLNEYHRDTSTVSNSYFNNLKGIKRTPLIHNQFGADIGGPIKHDKLFFYFDWADSRIIQSSTAEQVVPLADFRAGNLDYVKNTSGCSVSSHIYNAPGCIGSLTGAQIKALDPAATKIGVDQSLLTFITSRYPTANDTSYSGGDGVNTGGYRFTYGTPDTRHTYVGRIDYNLTSTQKIWGRTTITRRDAIYSGPQFPSDPPASIGRKDRTYSYVVGHTWNIGKNKVNSFEYGDTVEKFDFPALYDATPGYSIGLGGLTSPYASASGQGRRTPIPLLRDDFTWQKGNHSITFGGTFKFIKTHSYLTNNFNFVSIGMAGSSMGNGFDATVRPSDILNNATVATHYDNLFATTLGAIGEVATNFTYNNKGVADKADVPASRNFRYYQTEAYFGDVWRITPKLSLDYGVRYQYYSVPFETHGIETIATTNTGSVDLNAYMAARVAAQKTGNTSNTALPIYSYILAGKANNGPSLYAPNWKDFAPRFGFAYTPYGNGKFVINGGAGIVFDRTVTNAINFLADQISYMFYASNTYQASGSSATNTLATAYRVGSNLSINANTIPSAPVITNPYTPYVDGSGQPYGLPEGDSSFVVDPKLKDPYSIALNFGIQQELPGRHILKINYAGRLGRRLLASVDASQVMDVPDYSGLSTQTMVQAMSAITQQVRAGADYTTVTAQPWFENNMGYVGKGRRTLYATYFGGDKPVKGDLSDWIYTLAAYNYYRYPGFFPQNMGMAAQFGSNVYETNMSSSNYHGLLVTVDKNMSHGVRYEFNYTLSHAIDNASLIADSNPLTMSTPTGMLCDFYNHRACRGNSDFDVRQEIAANFTVQLPFGKGRAYLNHANKALDEIIGGWNISGLPTYRTGLALTAYSSAFLAGFDNLAPAIFTGSQGDLRTKVNVDPTTKTVWQFAGGSTGAAKAVSEFRGPIGLEYGQRNYFRGPGNLNIDAGLAKDFPLYNTLKLRFRADAYNVLNHTNFGSGALNVYNNSGNFGQISGTYVSSGNANRVGQFSLRLEY